jgi:hypothetical protein
VENDSVSANRLCPGGTTLISRCFRGNAIPPDANSTSVFESQRDGIDAIGLSKEGHVRDRVDYGVSDFRQIDFAQSSNQYWTSGIPLGFNQIARHLTGGIACRETTG